MVQALARSHPFHPILDEWVLGKLVWAVSTPILLEYQEVLIRCSGPKRWFDLARLMELAEQTSDNLLRINPSYRFNLIKADPDDNIFADCAIAADADYIITEDHHFAALNSSGFRTRSISPLTFVGTKL